MAMTVQDDERLAAEAIQATHYKEAMRLLRPLAERHSEYALLTLGWICETGAVGAPDKNAARIYYEQAAAEGSVSAYLNLGRVLLDQGEESKARAALERGVQLNDEECKSALAELENFFSEERAAQAMEAMDYAEAARLLRPLVERHSQYALLTLGWIYETGAIGVPDKSTARIYYEQAAAEGSASAYLHLGCLLLDQGEQTQAQAAFERGAQLGNDECKEKLAWQSIRSKNYEKAVELLQPLAERNSKYALLTLGWIYETGRVGSSDENAARLYYERAAAEGSAAAYYELGRLVLRQGNESEALAAFEAGAERGDIPSMAWFGRMLAEGRGRPADIAAGSAWLKKAAAQGNISARRGLLIVEARASRSLFRKIVIFTKMAGLLPRIMREIWDDKYSDKLR